MFGITFNTNFLLYYLVVLLTKSVLDSFWIHFLLFPVSSLRAAESSQLFELVFLRIQPESLPLTFFLCRMPISAALTAATLIELYSICAAGRAPSEGGEGNAEINSGGWERGEMHVKLLAAYPRTLWTLYSNELLFPPINNTSLRLCQTAMLQPFNTHPAESERRMKEGGKSKALWWMPNYILFSFSLRKMDFKASTT